MNETRNIYQKLHSIKSAGIKLKRDTQAYNYSYATLSQIQEKFWELLQEQWLVVIHSIIDWKVRTEIRDTESEELVSSEIEMTQWIKPQDKGSEITYYRRYNLLSLLDLEVDDDDWKKAQESKKEETPTDRLLNSIRSAESMERLEELKSYIPTTCKTEKQSQFFMSEYMKRADILKRAC